MKRISFAIFLLTSLLGFWAGGFFERYVFNFGFVQNFSATETSRLRGKTVRENCYEAGVGKEKRGKVIGFSLENYILRRVSIKWDDSESVSFTNYQKDYFSRCIEVID